MKRLTLLIAIISCFVTVRTAQCQQSEPTRVLFIGNSYTYFNDLPEIFAKLAEAGHHTNIETKMSAPGGWRLKDHWEKGSARQLLDTEKWAYVVLQDQSTLGKDYWVDGKEHVSNSDTLFHSYAKAWAEEAHAKGAMPVFFLTWAGKNAPEDQQALNYAYAGAAKETKSLLAPVGMAWAEVRREKPEVGLFHERYGSHPSPAGSYLAACVLYATIMRQNPLGLPSKISGTPVNVEGEKQEASKAATLVDLNPNDAEALQQEAWSTFQQLASHGGYPDVSPPVPPAVRPLPAGVPLSEQVLYGTWAGTITLYPVGPVDMVLHVEKTPLLKARLEMKYHSKDFADESILLSDFRIEGSRLLFSDPKSPGVDNLEIRLTGVMPARGELQGTAEASRENAEVLGSWSLKKLP